MTIEEAIRKRHSVRSYISKSIPDDIKKQLEDEIANCNIKGNLRIQLVTDDNNAFKGLLAHYGKFNNVQNYIAMIGKKSNDLEENVGYYGERIVLLAQMLGLNTCWVALTFKKGAIKAKCQIEKDEKLACVIALGYGETKGISHKSKDISEVSDIQTESPDWYKKGIEFVLLAPTAMNQQKFSFKRDGNNVQTSSTGGFYSNIDLGIAKYHFEIGAGKENFKWSK